MITHGYAFRGKRIPEYGVWAEMIQRCHNLNSNNYKNYGRRGISVCDRWRKSFQDFINDVGRRPTDKHSIDRIDVNGNYEPSNVKWSTKIEQCRNTTRNRRVSVEGRTMTIKEWSTELGIPLSTLRYRVRMKIWPLNPDLVERAR